MNETDPRLSLEDWLHAAYARDTDDAAGCPPPEAFLEAEAADRTPEERRRLEAHADRCPACAAERDLARLFDAGPEAAGVRPEDVDFVVGRLEAASPVRKAAKPDAGRVVPFPTAVRKPAAAPRPAFWRLAAAAVLVLGGGLLFQLTQSGPGAPALPAPGTESVMRGGEVEAVSPVGELAEVPAELRWTPRPGAVSYRVRLSTVDDTVLWETAVPAPPARLPAEVVRQLNRAVVYTWTVEALDASGRRLAASEPVRFRARPVP